MHATFDSSGPGDGAVHPIELVGAGEQGDPREATTETGSGPAAKLMDPPGMLAFGVSVAVVVPVILAAHLVSRRWMRTSGDARFRAQVTMLALSAVGVATLVMNLPMGIERKDLLAALGVVASAAIALSSTTLLGNMLAGLMLRGVHRYRAGDTISVGEHTGRVTERGVISTEIQTEHADLVEIPNLFLAQNPVKVVRSTGTVVTATVSLGYDVARTRIQELLKAAAENAGLKDPFVQVVDLGDYSVVYRTGGLLEEVKGLLSTRSKLRACMLDSLHEGGVEIVSPQIVARRELGPDARLVPPAEAPTVDEGSEGAVEDIAFDKAAEAESIEAVRGRLEEMLATRRELGERIKAAEPEEKARLGEELGRQTASIEQLEQLLKERKEALREE